MILKKLEMDNFMPFYLHNEIDFTPQHGQQIVLLKGDNGSGKSSTFDAMNFVLFGTPVESTDATGDGTEFLWEHDLVNLKIWKETDGFASVTAHFEHEGGHYTFMRKIEFKKLDPPALGTGICTVRCDHEKCKDAKMKNAEKLDEERKKKCGQGEFIVTDPSGPHVWPSEPSKRKRKQVQYVDSIVPKEGSRYYFFDGETIKNYTARPPEEPIKDVIEKLLGIKMLRNAIEDINDKKRDYESIKRKHGRTNNTAQTHATDADKAKGDIEFYEKKIDETSKALVHAESNKKRYEGMIAKNEDAEILLNKIIKLEEIRNDAQKLVILADGSLQEFNANNLPILFTLRLLDKIPRTQATSTVAEYASLTAADCITNDDCICKRPLDEASRGNLISVRDATTTNDPLENFMKCKDVLTPAYGIKTLAEAWGQIDQDIFDARRDVMEANRDIKETNNKLEIKTEDLKGEIDEARQGLFQVKKDIEEHERNARTWKSMKMQSEADYRKEMAEVSKLDRTPEIQEADACIKRTDQFIAAIDTVKDIVIGEQKTRIEDRASEIIGNVARTTMNVSGIKLDDKYTIMIESAGTGELRYTTDPPRPSKGQKQILGQSFVLALTRFAGFERPMFIDSPFMRLDSDYTTKIAEQLVEQDSQVMVLYQPDELKPGTGTQGARDGIEILKASAASEWEFTSVSEVETTITQVI